MRDFWFFIVAFALGYGWAWLNLYPIIRKNRERLIELLEEKLKNERK